MCKSVKKKTQSKSAWREAALKEFQEANERIEPLDMCLCVVEDGSHKVLPILKGGKFLDGEVEVEASWYCKATSATRLIGKLFSGPPDAKK